MSQILENKLKRKVYELRLFVLIFLSYAQSKNDDNI